jgi:hypothetical protein
MKRSHLLITVAFAVFFLMASAVAQTGAIKANIPFDFTIAKQTLPAGEYTITVKGMMLQLALLDGSSSLMVARYTAAYKNNVTPRLVFHRYGSRSFLSQVWTSDTVHELLTSPREIEYARTQKQERIVVLASALWHN